MIKKSARHTLVNNIVKTTSIIVFIGVYLLFSTSLNLFTIQTLSCQTDNGSCSEPILAELNRLRGTFFFSHKITATLDKITRNDPHISEIQIRRQFPHTISFLLHKKNSVAEIRCNDKAILVNIDGKIEESTRNVQVDIPTLTANSMICDTLITQGKIEMNDLYVLMSFSQTVTKETPELTLEWSGQSTVLVKTATQQRIVLPLNQLEQAFQMYRYLLDQGQLTDGWTELDLRFQKAIVKTQ